MQSRKCSTMDKLVEQTQRFRAIFISDLHLGTRRAQCDMILDFLRRTESDYLYIVGDLIDSWSLKKTWYWDQKHNDVIQKLLRKGRKGTRVIYLPGNHDENFREFCGHRFGRVAVLNETIHHSANGKRYLILHGDKFDSVIYFASWIGKLGDWVYERLMDFNVVIMWFRRLFGLGHWSLSAYLKLKVKRAVEFISRFETVVVREARSRNCQGVICGHIHTPDNRMIDGIHYLNDGDWVESCTALVEHFDGRFEVLLWKDHTRESQEAAVVVISDRDRHLAILSQ
jgi:UDP-2,3-diacylglucosamine pyrophosphatase LpxH